MLEGAHFTSITDIKATAVSCSYTYLSAWMEDLTQESPFKYLNGQLKDFDSPINKDTAIELENDLTIHIHQFLRKHDITKPTKLSYQIHHSVDFVSEQARPFVEFEEKAIAFQKFMELGLDCTVKTQWSLMNCGTEKQTTVLITKATTNQKPPNESDSYRNQGSMLFSFDKLGEKGFQNAIKNWFRHYEKYNTI